MNNHYRLIFLLTLYICLQNAYAQKITFNSHIGPIINTHCVSCHRENGSAPFSLTSYKEVYKRAFMIGYVTENKIMPPWKANSHFQTFSNEKGLTKEEIDLIKSWIEADAPEGKGRFEFDTRGFANGSQIKEKPDLILSMKESFTVQGNNKETYICYKIPFELERDTFARAIEFIPGNKKLVHHASCQILEVAEEVDLYGSPDYFVFADTQYMDDKRDLEYFNLFSKNGTPPKEVFHYGWLPGTSAQEYPDGMGFKLPKKGVFLIRNLHYAPTPVEQSDQSSVHIYFSKKSVERKIGFAAFKPVNPFPGKDWIIPSDSLKEFHINVKFHNDVSLLAINPHMHLLGKYYKVYAITPFNDTIPLVEIPQWDFNWQEFYRFRKLIVIPKGSVLRAEAVFDNTSSNPVNPHSPPQPVYFERGMNDKDEMMRLVILYLPYRKGDENVSLEITKEIK